MLHLRILSLCVMVCWVLGTRWDDGFDGYLLGEVAAPTEEPYPEEPNIYPDISFGTPPKSFPGMPKSKRIGREGRLDSRAPTCADPTYIFACPATENLPCCPPTAPVCCHDPSDVCCFTGTFCVGLSTCCPNGSTGCGEGCCDSDQLCCGTHCCNSNEICRSGTCVPRVDPTQSFLSAQSILSAQSVASVASVQSIASVISVASVQSIELSRSQQAEQSLASVGAVASQSRVSVSLLSEASVASVSQASLSANQGNTIPSDTPTSNSGSNKNQAIIGGAVGGGLAAILLLFTIFLCWRTRSPSSPTITASSAPLPMMTQSVNYSPGYTPAYGGTPGRSPYTSGYPGMTHALVYNEYARPNGAQNAGSGMPMWLQHNNNYNNRDNYMQGRPLSMGSASSPPNQNYVLPGNMSGNEGTLEGNASVYPSNAVTFYGPTNPHVPYRTSRIASEDATVLGEDWRASMSK